MAEKLTHSQGENSFGLRPEDVLRALRLWDKESSADSPFAHLYLFQQEQLENGGSNRRTTNAILEAAFIKLDAVHDEPARILRLRFQDCKTVYEVANEFNVAESTLHKRQQEAVVHLTTLIVQMEHEAVTARVENLIQLLPPQTDVELFGIDRHLKIIRAKLSTENSPWIIALEGIGGIGKTTLADALVRNVVQVDRSWQQVAWITAKRSELQMSGSITPTSGAALSVGALVEQLYDQLLPEIPRPASFDNEQVLNAIEEHLKEHKCLIVIDDLETIEDVETLLPTLGRLANPTKFVLTSRKSFYAASEVFHFQVPELNRQESVRLVRQEAAVRNLDSVAEAADQELAPIHETVGGNPLALRLVVGQLHHLDLNVVLDDLREVRGTPTENLYIFIFRHAWDRLAEPARQVLIAMILVDANGDTLDELHATCGLEHGALREALRQLVTLNLVDVRGGLNDRRYTIHNLTRAFLHKQVILWA